MSHAISIENSFVMVNYILRDWGFSLG